MTWKALPAKTTTIRAAAATDLPTDLTRQERDLAKLLKAQAIQEDI